LLKVFGDVEAGLEGEGVLFVPRIKVLPNLFGVFSSSSAVLIVRDLDLILLTLRW